MMAKKRGIQKEAQQKTRRWGKDGRGLKKKAGQNSRTAGLEREGNLGEITEKGLNLWESTDRPPTTLNAQYVKEGIMGGKKNVTFADAQLERRKLLIEDRRGLCSPRGEKNRH